MFVKTTHFGKNAGRRYKRCADRDCHYEEWVDALLFARGRTAVEELAAETNKLHLYYGHKLERLKKKSCVKRRTILLKLKEIHEKVVSEDSNSDEDDP